MPTKEYQTIDKTTIPFTYLSMNSKQEVVPVSPVLVKQQSTNMQTEDEEVMYGVEATISRGFILCHLLIQEV